MVNHALCCFFILLLPACTTVNTNDRTFQAEGFGGDCTEALKQAKLKAAEDYKGTFVSGQRTLVNDRKYTESLDEYSGGVVRSYKVLSSNGGSPCKVTIQAVIAPDTKSISVNSETSIELGDVERHLNHKSDTRELLRKMIQRPEMIKVESRTIDPVAYNDGSVGMAVNFTKLIPSPKWTTDLESFLAVHGTKITYREKNAWVELGKGLLAIVALPVLIPVAIIIAPFTSNKANTAPPPNPGDSFSLCFAGKDEVNCYQGWAADEIYQQMSSATIVAIMNKDGAPVAGFPVQGGLVSMNQHVDVKYPWVDDKNRPKSAFDLVAAKAINIHGKLTLASNWVSEGHDLKFRLKFN
jgi:hypothetical protein